MKQEFDLAGRNVLGILTLTVACEGTVLGIAYETLVGNGSLTLVTQGRGRLEPGTDDPCPCPTAPAKPYR